MSCACESMTMGGVDGGECDQPLVVTWPSDVDKLKARIDPIVGALDAGVKACKSLSAADQTSWAGTLAGWTAFMKESTPIFGSYNSWQTACSYAHTFDAWRARLVAEHCDVPGPSPINGVDTSVVKWLVGGAVILGLVVVAVKYAPLVR